MNKEQALGYVRGLAAQLGMTELDTAIMVIAVLQTTIDVLGLRERFVAVGTGLDVEAERSKSS